MQVLMVVGDANMVVSESNNIALFAKGGTVPSSHMRCKQFKDL
jgi:hypothetical protein